MILHQFRTRRAERRQRRERQKSHINAHDAAREAESSLYKHGFFTH